LCYVWDKLGIQTIVLTFFKSKSFAAHWTTDSLPRAHRNIICLEACLPCLVCKSLFEKCKNERRPISPKFAIGQGLATLTKEFFFKKWFFRLKHYMSSWRAPNSHLNPKRFRLLFLRDDYWRCQKYISIVVGSPVCCISSVHVATPFNNKEKAPRHLSFLRTVVARHPMLSLLSTDRTPSLPLARRFCESVEVHVK
jgi:hypothetical protein